MKAGCQRDADARTVEALFLDCDEHQLAAQWRPNGQAAPRLLKGFKVAVSALFGSAISAKGEDPFTPDWLMQPEADYEIEGFYRGCCFPCGTVVIGGTLFVYYGAADKYCAVATCDFGQLLEHLRKCPA